ncbi:MAG: flippase [Acidimicrobiales bacterium]|nr:flippase [Acidimicrobiales bacterium]
MARGHVTDERPTDDSVRGLGRSSLINLIGFGVFGLANFLLLAVMTRRLGTSGAGALLEAIAVFSILARTAMLGADIALVRFTSRFIARERRGEMRTLYGVALAPVLAVGTLAGLAMFALAEPLGRALADGVAREHLITHLRVMAPFVPVATVYQVVEGGSRGFGTMLPSVVVERIGRSITLPGLMLAAIAWGAGATGIALAWAGPYAVALIPMGLWVVALVRRAEGAVGRAAPAAIPTRELARRVWRFSLPRAFAGMFAFLISWIDALMLGAMKGASAVGVYSAATRWLIAGNFAGTAVTQAFAPRVSRALAIHGSTAGRRLFQDATALLVLVAWPAYLTAIVFAPLLLSAFGDDFVVGAHVIAIVGAGFLVASSAGPIDMLLLMAGRSSLSLVNAAVALAVNFVANLVLIPPFGIEGAAWAWAASLVVSNALPVFQMWRSHGIQPYGPRTRRALLIVSTGGLALLAARSLLGASVAGLTLGLLLAAGVVAVGIRVTPDRLGVGELLGRSSRW